MPPPVNGWDITTCKACMPELERMSPADITSLISETGKAIKRVKKEDEEEETAPDAPRKKHEKKDEPDARLAAQQKKIHESNQRLQREFGLVSAEKKLNRSMFSCKSCHMWCPIAAICEGDICTICYDTKKKPVLQMRSCDECDTIVNEHAMVKDDKGRWLCAKCREEKEDSSSSSSSSGVHIDDDACVLCGGLVEFRDADDHCLLCAEECISEIQEEEKKKDKARKIEKLKIAIAAEEVRRQQAREEEEARLERLPVTKPLDVSNAESGPELLCPCCGKSVSALGGKHDTCAECQGDMHRCE